MSDAAKTQEKSDQHNQMSRAAALLNRVHGRMKTAALGRSFYFWGLVSIGVGAAGVAGVRMLGLLTPAEQRWEWLAAIPAVAVVLGSIFHRKVPRTQAARELDKHAQTKDLFLTYATLESAAGDYQPLVERAAEKAAEKIKPVEVVPFRMGRSLGITMVSAAALVLAVVLLPQMDPFGKVEAAVRKEEKKQEVVAIRKAARARQEQLQKEAKVAEETSSEIEKEIEALKSAFRAMKPQEKQNNSKVLQSKAKAFNDNGRWFPTKICDAC